MRTHAQQVLARILASEFTPDEAKELIAQIQIRTRWSAASDPPKPEPA